MSGARHGGPSLPLRLRWQVYLRSLSLQASWNTQRMQNLGLLATLLPWLRRRPRDSFGDRLFCRRYYEFFNTNPYLAGYVIGGLLRLETDVAEGADLPRETAATFRDSLGRALASLGDQLFWLGLRPALALAACLAALAGGAKAVILLVLAFAATQLVWRWRALGSGFELGFEVVDLLGRAGWHRGIAWSKRAGMVLCGVLAGRFLFLGNELAGPEWPLAPVALVLAGLLLPPLLRRRWPGEVMVLVATVVAVLASFAFGFSWS